MKNITIDSDVLWPIAIGVFLVVLSLGVTSCTEETERLRNDETKMYLDNGCERIAITGSTGTHWVCSE